MIINVINALLVALSMGAHLGAPISPTKQTQNTQKITVKQNKRDTAVNNYNLELSLTSGQNSNRTLNYGMYNITKYNINGYNSALNVHGQVYRQDFKYTDSTPYYWTMNGYTTTSSDTNLICQMFSLAITPYNINVETQFKLSISISAQAVDTITNGGFTIQVLESIDNGFAQMIDSNSWQTNDLITQYNQVKSATNGFTYNMHNYEINGLNPLQPGWTLNNYLVNFNIQPTLTNYIIIMVQPYAENPENEDTTLVKNFSWYGDFNTGTHYYVQGTNIIPTTATEVVDIPGIMFDVLTMPFSFISIAFNLTLFPGTPYQVNISNLFLIIIAIVVFIFVMRLIIKLASSNGG